MSQIVATEGKQHARKHYGENVIVVWTNSSGTHASTQHTNLRNWSIMLLIVCLTLIAEGWAIPAKDLLRKEFIGKGEFKGMLYSITPYKLAILWDCPWDYPRILCLRTIEGPNHKTVSSIYTEVWLGEYQGAKVAIKMHKELHDQQLLREASIMT